MSYLPLNNKNFEVGDIVVCIENRFARTFDHRTGFRTFGNENLPFITLQKEYIVIEKDSNRRKVKVNTDDNSYRWLPYYRMGVEENDD